MQTQTALRKPEDPAALRAPTTPEVPACGGGRRSLWFGSMPAAAFAALTLTFLAFAPGMLAQTVRVTTWNLQPPAPGTNAAAANTNTIRIPAAATALKKLNPDVILLQQITDWATCEQLVEALKPADYHVVVCSAFPDLQRKAARRQQVAILAKAKTKAYFSWSAPWRNQGGPALPGGYAFAAFQIGQERIGVFSVQAGASIANAAGKQTNAPNPQVRSAAAVGQLLAQVDSIRNWVTNRVQVFAIGGPIGVPGRKGAEGEDSPFLRLEEAGFGDAFLELTPAERATMPTRPRQPGLTADYIFTQPAGCTTNPRILPVNGIRHYPVTCDVGLGPAAAIAAQINGVETAPAPAPKRNVTQAKGTKPSPSPSAEPAAAPPATQAPEPPRQATNTAAAPKPAHPEPPVAVASSHPSVSSSQLLWYVAAFGGVIIAVAALAWVLARRSQVLALRPPALLTDGTEAPSSFTVIMATRSATEAAPAQAPRPPAREPIIHVEATEGTHTQAEALRQRALAAEQKAERAQAVIRSRLIPHLGHWLKQKLVLKLMTDRAQLLETQQTVAHRTQAVEERLARIEQQIQAQNDAYQARIEELTKELVTAKEENRELIRARIAQVKAEMAAARARLMAQSEADRAVRE